MTPQEITLVQTSWQKVVPIKEKAAELFYGKLFEMDPSLRPLFKGDTVEQGRKLMAMINTVVTKLDQLDDIVPAVQELGRRHVAYGVKDEDYDTVAGALLWTSLGAGLGDAFTDEVKGAWTSAYLILAGAMKDAAATAWD
ncbi:MAG: globin family protein [Cupriavidus necator]